MCSNYEDSEANHPQFVLEIHSSDHDSWSDGEAVENHEMFEGGSADGHAIGEGDHDESVGPPEQDTSTSDTEVDKKLRGRENARATSQY